MTSTNQSTQSGHFQNTKIVNRDYKNIKDLGLERDEVEIDRSMYGACGFSTGVL